MRAISCITLAALGLNLAGCSANHHSIFRVEELAKTSPTIVAVDAKQRALVANRKAGADWVRFCSEPSPDVFSVMAQAFSGGASLGKSADPKSLQVALEAAFSSAEQGSTIPRTQTINMLRELMFRTCERYMNGGYTELELSVQAIRDQRLMVSILAIESLTGAVAARPVGAGASASGGAGVTGDAIVRLDDARKARDAAQTTVTSAQKGYDEENGSDKTCDALRKLAAEDVEEAQEAKFNACTEKWAALTKAKDELQGRSAAYGELSRLATTGGVSTGTSLGDALLGGLDRVADKQISDVAEAVSTIVRANMNDNSEFLFFCMKVFQGGEVTSGFTSDQRASLAPLCFRYLDAEFRAAEARLDAEIAESAGGQGSTSIRNFVKLWRKKGAELTTGDAATQARTEIAATVSAMLTPVERPKAECFKTATDEAAFLQCFDALSLPAQRELLRVIGAE